MHGRALSRQPTVAARRAGDAKPFVQVTLGPENYEDIKSSVASRIMEIMPEMMRNTQEYPSRPSL